MVRQELGEDPELAHPPGDQLGVLAAVVEDDDLVRGHLALERQLVDALLGDGGVADLHYGFLRRCAAGMRAAGGAYSVAARAMAPPRAPMPTAWSRCSCLPSLCSDGAIISSARLNSAMSR